MTVASRAVMMAVMTEARMMGTTDEGQSSNWLWVGKKVALYSAMVALDCGVEVGTDVRSKSSPEYSIQWVHC